MSMHEELRALRDLWRKNADDAESRVKGVEEYTGIPTTGGPANAWIDASRIHADRIDQILAEYADWVCVPVEPTEAMLSAAAEVGGTKKRQTYKAMLQSAAKAEEE